MPQKTRKCLNWNRCHAFIYTDNKTGFCRPCYDQAHAAPKVIPAPVQVAQDREKQKAQAELTTLKLKYKESLKTIERQDVELGWMAKIRDGIVTTTKIEPHYGSGTSEACPVINIGDWHSEERVTRAQTSGLNEYNLDIFDRRQTKFWQSSLRLLQLLNQDVKITTVILALLGDFITNDIHDAENAESNALLPVDALLNVESKLVSGIQFLLDNTKFRFKIVCKVGNHSRTTKTTRFATENGHSLETLMYVHMADHFRNEPRVEFVIDNGYHTYVNVYDQVIRFHHGHELKFGGGIGGLFIPAFKAISQWNKGRHADLDVFGHFHQDKFGGNFYCNGSLIGYNAFALSIKADYEKPSQTLFLVDKKRGRTCSWPILVE